MKVGIRSGGNTEGEKSRLRAEPRGIPGARRLGQERSAGQGKVRDGQGVSGF